MCIQIPFHVPLLALPSSPSAFPSPSTTRGRITVRNAIPNASSTASSPASDGTRIHKPSVRDDSARRPEAFDSVVNTSLRQEFTSTLVPTVSTLTESTQVALLLLRSSDIAKVTLPFLSRCKSVSLVVDCPQDERVAYEDCRNRLHLTLLNRIVVAGATTLPTRTFLWFVVSVTDYSFNLDAVRVPSKYPGKRSTQTGQLSGNPLGKNPSDIWNMCPDGTASCRTDCSLLRLPECAARALVRSLVPVGDTVCISEAERESAPMMLALQRNVDVSNM